MTVTAVRGALLSFADDPFLVGAEASRHYWPDGGMVIEEGRITSIGDWRDVSATLPAGAQITDYSGHLILPGFIDAHVHYAQMEVIAAFGTQLLEWLEKYTFPAEQKFSDPAHARLIAELFLGQLLENGVTTAGVFCTSSPVSVDQFFAAADGLGLRMIAGKVLMDRNAPASLRDTAQGGYDESKALIDRWHGKGRLLYGITPRFAITSTEEQLELAGALAREAPDTFIQSHVSENRAEIETVRRLFPQHRSYTEVYAHYGLLRERAVYAHGVWLDEEELRQFHEAGAIIAHCPTSNTFIGSGLLDLNAVQKAGRPVKLAIGTDVGGGTSFSIFKTLGESYKVMQLQGHVLSALRAFYLATLGGARALGLEADIGSLDAGSEADFCVIDPGATPLMKFRMEQCESVEDQLFVLMTLGDERNVVATWAGGRCLHQRPAAA
ncbi:guanine deaminase [Radicibacter daui]|uniref:guanine deaminase n=1 Tax=Radicibacter daui TaxID=3064829 RepID=UPI0040468C70